MNYDKKSREADKFVVRLPDGLREQVASAADEADTSMNTIVVQALRQFLDRQQRQEMLLDALAVAVDGKMTTLERYAARYRFLRDGHRNAQEYWDNEPCVCSAEDTHFGEDLDRLVDSAIEAMKERANANGVAV